MNLCTLILLCFVRSGQTYHGAGANNITAGADSQLRGDGLPLPSSQIGDPGGFFLCDFLH